MKLRIILITLFTFLFCFSFDLVAAIDIITSSQFIKDPEYISSSGNIFRLGFFSPDNSTYRYVGIWYSDIPEITPVWVANRNRPLNASSGTLTIFQDGNLVVLNGQQQILWSSNVSIPSRNSTARLNDYGNLELRDSSNGSIMWESFQEPSDTFLPNMKLTANQDTGERTLLRSWKTASDPSVGRFSGGISPQGAPQLFIWNESRPFWRSRPWDGQVFMGVFEANSVLLTGNRTYSLSYPVANQSFIAHFVLTPDGELRQKYWDAQKGSWGSDWKLPATVCDVYGVCGSFGVCNAQNSPICSCLRGFEPRYAEEWNRRNWTGGCVRRRLLQCERTENGSDVGREDGFLKLEMMKVPDLSNWSSYSLEQECHDMCLSNCSCVAYAYEDGAGCLSWSGNLTDLAKYSDKGADLYVRLTYSEIERDGDKKALISLPVIAAAIVIAVCAFFSWRWVAAYKERKNKSSKLLFTREINMHTISEDDMNQVKLQELPLFSLEALSNATDEFDESNKLGQGGFGPVYRGKLPDGREIAVKRLSRVSGQGQAELTNEVVVISKLQHRNLVRLFGCCVDGEEKMLVYEFMPNGSLDAFIFDPIKGELLDWKKRFNIVEGVCRGLLYLHRDSRLKIIHRDLKASNILLDLELNPKISDFGMARIFGGNEDQANTNRVVGTYGYMSPEYAMEGKFSEKSDVYSFGVLLLEVIRGRRNTSFYNSDQALSLLGFAWKLWNEGKMESLIDPLIRESCVEEEVMRCIHVGMLCVQEFPNDRPSVSTIISMLNSDIIDLPVPRQPAFTLREVAFGTDSSQQSHKTCSVDDSDIITKVQSR